MLAWTVGRFTGRCRRAGSMGLAALVGTQLGQTLLTGWCSPVVVGTTFASAAALFAVIETPGVSHFFGCTPIGPVAWAVVVSSAATGTLAAVAAPHVFLAREQES
jgi:cation-transporting P-type ATPase I